MKILNITEPNKFFSAVSEMPARLHLAASMSMRYCGKFGLKLVCADSISGRFSRSARKVLATS